MFNFTSPAHVAGITQPVLLLPAVAAAGPADVKPTVQTLMFDADQKPKRLQTADAVKLRQVALVPQQLSLGLFSLNLSFQISEKKKERRRCDKVHILYTLPLGSGGQSSASLLIAKLNFSNFENH